MKEYKKSLSRKIAIYLIFVMTLVSLFSSLVYFTDNKNYILNEYENKNTLAVKKISKILKSSFIKKDFEEMNTISQAFISGNYIMKLEIFDNKKILIKSYVNKKIKNIKKEVFIFSNNDFVTKTWPILDKNKTLSNITLTYSKYDVNKQLSYILISSIIKLCIILCAMSLLTFIISKKLLCKPIDSLVKTTNNFGDKSFSLENNFEEFYPLINVLKKMNNKISKQVNLLNDQKKELEFLLVSFDENIISSKTDRNGIITHVSEAFCKNSEYEINELVGKTHRIVKHNDSQSDIFEDMWENLNLKRVWKGQIKNKSKQGNDYWIDIIIKPELNDKDEIIGFSEISQNITAQKELVSLSQTLEKKVQNRTKQLLKDKQFISSIMDSQNSMVITSNGKKVTTVNKAFVDFFEIKDKNNFFEQFEGNVEYTRDNSAIFYLKECAQSQDWLNYIYENQNQVHKIKLNENIFTITIDRFIFEEEGLFTLVLTDITELEKIRNEIENINNHTRESIEYSALIQNSLIPSADLFNDYFEECFLIWKPKDIVGGDIYLFETLRNKDECLIMLIDCTGHGVPGAFVTMLVKAIEKQITTIIKTNKKEVNTAKVLEDFNKEMKSILEHKHSENKVNAGFDGSILYFNKKENIVRFSGARIPLYYTKNEKLFCIKGDRHSVGYNHSNVNYEFTQHELKLEKDMTFYIASDGFIDQSGGESSFSFGRKRFENMIENHIYEDLKLQKDIYMKNLSQYQANEETYDDITFLALKT